MIELYPKESYLTLRDHRSVHRHRIGRLDIPFRDKMHELKKTDWWSNVLRWCYESHHPLDEARTRGPKGRPIRSVKAIKVRSITHTHTLVTSSSRSRLIGFECDVGHLLMKMKMNEWWSGMNLGLLKGKRKNPTWTDVSIGSKSEDSFFSKSIAWSIQSAQSFSSSSVDEVLKWATRPSQSHSHQMSSDLPWSWIW